MPENMQNPICLSFPSAEPRARRARHQAPATPAGFRRGWTVKLSQGRGPGDGRTEGQRDGGGGRQLHSPEGDAPGPGTLSAGRKPKREELEQSSLAHPSVERQGGGTRAEERRCGRGAAVSGAGRIRAPAPSPHAPPCPPGERGLTPPPVNKTQARPSWGA